jgi:hypothetical protein
MKVTKFIYTIGLEKLYSSRSLNQLIGELGIHPVTANSCIKTGKSYLDFFMISDTELKNTVKSDLTLDNLIDLIREKKKLLFFSFFFILFLHFLGGR